MLIDLIEKGKGGGDGARERASAKLTVHTVCFLLYDFQTCKLNLYMNVGKL